MRAYRWGVAIGVLLCAWVVLNIGMSILGNGVFYKTLSPMPYLRETDTHVVFYSWYWLWMPMNISSGKLLECDGRIMSFAPVDIKLASGVGENEYGWEKAHGVSGRECIIRGTVTYSPFGSFGAKMTTSWVSDPFVLGEP